MEALLCEFIFFLFLLALSAVVGPFAYSYLKAGELDIPLLGIEKLVAVIFGWALVQLAILKWMVVASWELLMAAPGYMRRLYSWLFVEKS